MLIYIIRLNSQILKDVLTSNSKKKILEKGKEEFNLRHVSEIEKTVVRLNTDDKGKIKTLAYRPLN